MRISEHPETVGSYGFLYPAVADEIGLRIKRSGVRVTPGALSPPSSNTLKNNKIDRTPLRSPFRVWTPKTVQSNRSLIVRLETSDSSFISSETSRVCPEDSIDVGGLFRLMDKGRHAGTVKSREDLEREGYRLTLGRPFCSGCGRRIVWMISPNRKKIPFETDTFSIHWATCPQAEAFRNPRFVTPGKKRQK